MIRKQNFPEVFIDQFLALTREYEEVAVQRGQGVTHGGLLAWLRNLAASGEDQRSATTSDAVRITTWHGAKGLEWPMVVLYGFGDEPQTRFFGISAFTAGPVEVLDEPSTQRVRAEEALGDGPLAYGPGVDPDDVDV